MGLCKVATGLDATQVTEKGLFRIENHLKNLKNKYGMVPGEKESAMIRCLREGKRTDWDLKFYQHELRESREMHKVPEQFKNNIFGGIPGEAHRRTSYKYSMDPDNTLNELIHPDVIKYFDNDH